MVHSFSVRRRDLPPPPGAGARYHTELSRQLADFLAAPLARAGGILQLPDIYCLFNRWAAL